MKVRKICYKMLIIILIIVILLPNMIFFTNYSNAVNAGEKISIPKQVETCKAEYDTEEKNWDSGTGQESIYKLWKSQGKKTDKNNWAYVTIGGKKRYIIKLAQIFGIAGDYIEITLNNGKSYSCVIGDSKNLHETKYEDNTNNGAYYDDNEDMYGTYLDGKCSVVELMLKGTSKVPSNSFLESFADIKTIKNNGSSLTGNTSEEDTTFGETGVQIGSVDEWLETLENMTEEMLADGGWIYSNSNNKTDYNEAKKQTPRRSNCALMVVHALQLFRSI